ncbi:MAG: BamA/TamA family outer membrane protein [Oligoflexales bacterium]|nr:BamA/TamA family outer membrane protein [Oligoflexales bacterium]
MTAVVFILTAYLLIESNASAAEWSLSSELEKKIDTSGLRNRYPTIASANDLQDILQDLGRVHPFLSLEARWNQGTWQLDGELAEFIQEIKIKLITNKLEQILEGVRQKYIGRVDSLAIRSKVVDGIKEALESTGYPSALISFQLESKNGAKIYKISVDEGVPCLIRKIHHDFKIPDKTKLQIAVGDLCNLEKISASLNELEYDLLSSGYKDANIKLKKIELSKDKKFGDVYISGVTGRRTVYDVIDQSNLFFVDDIFDDGEIERKNVSVTSPEIMVSELYKFYLSKGYEDVKISKPEKRQVDKNTDKYQIKVYPGKQYLLSNIRFEGNYQFSSDELKEIMNLNNFWETSIVLDREKFATGIDSLKVFYKQNGYWDVKIHSPRITKDKFTGTAQMVILINEGKKRILERVDIRGNEHFDDGEIRSLLSIDQNEFINKNAILEFQESLRAKYLESGFHYVSISINLASRFDFRSVPTSLTVRIQEGKRVRIGNINIVGLVKTEKQVVERELLFEKVDWYNPKIIAASRNAVINLGIFKSVQIAPTDHVSYLDKAEVLDVTVEVYEGNAGSIVFGPGYNFRKGIQYTTEFSYNNLWGTGRQFSLRASLSQEKNQRPVSNPTDTHGKVFLGRKLGAGYVEPYILDLPVNGNIAVSHQGTAFKLWEISNSFDLSLTYKTKFFLEGSWLSTFYNFKLSKSIGTDKQQETLISTGDSKIGSVGLRYNWDRRDNISWPTAGDIIQAELSWARYFLAGEFQYFKWDFSYRRFSKLMDRLVWGNGFSVTAYDSIARKDNLYGGVLPSSERLAAHGVNRVRGFEQDLGPIVVSGDDTPETILGTKRAILKSDLRYRISKVFATSVFIDSGNTFLPAEEIAKLKNYFETETPDGKETPVIEENISYEFSELLKNPGYLYNRHYLAYGFSLSFITPVGPLNAFFSWPLREPTSVRCSSGEFCYSRESDKDRWYKKTQFDINIGAEF